MLLILIVFQLKQSDRQVARFLKAIFILADFALIKEEIGQRRAEIVHPV